MSVDIRTPQGAEELDRIVDIALAAWVPIFESYREMLGNEIYDVAHPAWKPDKERQIRSAYAETSPVQFLVAEMDGRIAGFVTWVIARDGKTAEIGNNAVDPAFQRRGIATMLYGAVIERLKAASVAVVSVTTGLDPSHAPARRAYEKAGFARSKPIVTYYQDLR